MIFEKKTALKPLLESSEGVHLTGYLVNRSDLIELKKQLRQIINDADEFLIPVMTPDQRNKFLEPLDALLNDARIFKDMRGNIGIFRTENSFRVLNIPVEVEESCVVATSFHVKPLLRWMQEDCEFLLLGLEDDSAHLYQGSQSSLRRVDTVIYPEIFRKESGSHNYQGLKQVRMQKHKAFESQSWVHDWIEDLTRPSRPKLFIAGEKSLTTEFLKQMRYGNAYKEPVYPSFNEAKVSEIVSQIRGHLKREVNLKLERALLEFRLAEDMNLSKKNIFQIAKAAVKGRVRKLLVADGIKIFGKLDQKTGGLAIHPFDLDHEDDDLLDDLAQTVLTRGGEVIVASREEIPERRPLMAILDYNTSTEISVSTEYEDLSEIKERRSV